jgi:hypothetical protein
MSREESITMAELNRYEVIKSLLEVDRLKGAQIYHKDGCRNLPPDRSSVSSTTFCGNISLTYKSGFPIYCLP